MRLIEITNNIPNFIDVQEAEIGKVYHIYGNIERGTYKGNLNTYFNEIVKPGKCALLMTKNDGSKPFAVATNDCERDGFDPFHLSRIFVDNGNYVIYAYRTKEESESQPAHVIIFETLNKFPEKQMNLETMEVKAICKFDTDEFNPNAMTGMNKFKDVVSHLIKVLDVYLPDQLIPKYCFNPNRLITLRLFQRNEKDELETFLSDGRRLVLNAHSKERIKDNKVINGGLFRVFFSRKFKDSKHIFVDGKALNPLHAYSLSSYIEESQLDSPVIKSTIKKIKTKLGQKFFVVTNLNGEIRPIYESNQGYSSFKLNSYELGFVDSIDDVTEWI